MRFIHLLTYILFFAAETAVGQYFQFSQYNYATQRINPGMVAPSNYASASLLYRNQSAGGGFDLNSSFITGAFPIINGRTGQRWAGIGMSLMDDRSGGIFSTQEASLSYAFNVYLSKFQTLSLGFKGLYLQRKVNLDGLVTGSQYVPDRGFDQSIYSGENISVLRSDFLTFSSGLYWQQTDRDGNRLAYWGISLFDFNKPEDSFSGVESQLNSTLIFNGGIRLYENKQIAFMPEVLFTRSASNNVFNIGAVTSYFLRDLPSQFAARVDLLTKYVTGRSGIIGLQFHRENFSVGFSYDFPVMKKNAGNFNAFEIGVELRKLVDPKVKKRSIAKRKSKANQKQNTTANSRKKPDVVTSAKKNVVTKADTIPQPKPKERLASTLKHKQDSALASVEAGKIKHEPLVLEKITLHFNFEFNSSDLDEKSMQYLDDLVEALNENEHLKIHLTGHTDNVGSAKFNQRLSLYRADVIKQYLTGKGVSDDRIKTDGKGLTKPLNDNRTEEDRAKNRRVELEILYQD